MKREQYLYSLHHSVRVPVVLKYFGQLCLALSFLMSVCLAVSLVFREDPIALRFFIATALLAVMGALLGRLKGAANVQANEALAVASLIFLFSPLVMTYPFMASGLGFEDAVFEAVSAVTTTGLTTVALVEDRPRSFLFARAWMQWSGGLGIVILTVALLTGPGMAARRLAYTETEAEDVVGSARAHARRVLVVYLILTGGGILLLWALSSDFFNSLVHALSAVSTGGMSSFDDGLAGFGGWTVPAAAVFISISGAISLGLYYRGMRRGWREFFADVEVKALAAACLISAGFLIGISGLAAGWGQPGLIGEMGFLAFSAQTTTGFSTVPVAELDSASKLVLVASMAVGGTVGSTAGGVKVLRLLIFLRLVHLSILKTCLPGRAVVEPRLGGHRLESEELERALLLIVLFVVVVVCSWVPFVVMGHEPLDALFEVVSAMGTVGLSAGVTGPNLDPVLKGVLCVDMLMGRLEILAILVLLYPRTWFGRRVAAP